MFTVLLSVLLGAFVTIALLLVTRQRLARQFDDVQRRLLQAERTLVELRAWQAASTTEIQLERIQTGLVRAQENVANRYGGLLPLAHDLGRRPADEQRFLADFQLAGLVEWASAMQVPLTSAEIARWARAIDHAEAAGAVEVAIPTIDLLAQAIGLAGVAKGGGWVEVAGSSALGVVSLLRTALPQRFGATEFRQAPAGGEPAGVLLLDKPEALWPEVAQNGVVITTGPAREREAFDAIAGPGNVVAYRRWATALVS